MKRLPKRHSPVFRNSEDCINNRNKIGAVSGESRACAHPIHAWAILDGKESSPNHVIYLGTFKNVAFAASAVEETVDTLEVR